MFIFWALKKVQDSYNFLDDFSKNKVIYGINTCFGPMAQYKISDDDQKTILPRLWSAENIENYINFTPNPSVTKETIETTALRGFDGKLYSIEELCSGAW